MKVTSSGLELNTKVLSGVNKLADAVSSTLGPKGRNVIIQEKDKRPIITKDGVSVASHFELPDPLENVGAQIIKQAAGKTNTDAGDGTTTSTVLARAIVNYAQKYLVAGASPTEMKRGMEKALVQVKDMIKQYSKPVASLEDIKSIATISANNDLQIGTLISLAVDKAGRDGAVTIEESRSTESSLDIVEGFGIDSGFVSPRFINDERKSTARLNDSLVLVTDHSIENVEDMLPVLEIAAREKRPLTIVADDVSGQALASLIVNTMRGNMKIVAVKAPRYGEERRQILSDLALSLGATFVTRESGALLTDVKRNHLGFVKMCESGRGSTTFMGGNGDPLKIRERIDYLKEDIDRTQNLADCERIQERISRLQSAVAIIRVGGATEIDMIERKDRVIDALEAVKSAQAEGILPGGGTSLVHFSNLIESKLGRRKDLTDDERIGYKIVIEAMRDPLRVIATNCGLNSEVILNDVKRTGKFGIGYNFSNGKYGSMIKQGVIDPAKVTRCALENAISAASTLLTTSHAIVES